MIQVEFRKLRTAVSSSPRSTSMLESLPTDVRIFLMKTLKYRDRSFPRRCFLRRSFLRHFFHAKSFPRRSFPR